MCIPVYKVLIEVALVDPRPDNEISRSMFSIIDRLNYVYFVFCSCVSHRVRNHLILEKKS